MDRNTSELIYDWKAAPAGEPRRVQVLDNTLRDGLQSPSVRDPELDEKRELLRLAHRVGVGGMVLGLPGAGPRAREEVASLASFLQTERLALVLATGVRTHPADIRAHLEACAYRFYAEAQAPKCKSGLTSVSFSSKAKQTLASFLPSATKATVVLNPCSRKLR